MNKIITLLIFCLFTPWSNLVAQSFDFEPILKAMRDSDVKSLSGFFNPAIELNLPDNNNTFSSSQAEMIMKELFKKYPPDSIKLVHEGTSDNHSGYAICDYRSGDKLYQLYIHLRMEKEKYLIQKIKFEEKK